VPVPAAPKRDQPFAVGDVVWDFASLAQTGQRVRLHDFADKPVLVYFCPSNSVEACSALADTLTQRWLEVNPHLSMVFGVTQDDLITQREFGVLHEVPFLFLADTEGTLARGFGLAPGAVTSFLIDKDAHVRKVFTPPTANHPAEIVAALTELHLLAPAQPL
jgi:peroxiredoxin Q/BCP